MMRICKLAAALFVGALVGAVLAPLVSQPLNYFEQGTSRLVIGGTQTVASGGVLNVASGGALQLAGSDRTSVLSTAPAAVAAGYKIARGQSTTVAASDTIASGLATVVAVVCTLDSDPTDNPQWVSCSIGDQAGAPAAGSFLLKTWQNTTGTDPTPLAATTFAKKVNWLAIGT